MSGFTPTGALLPALSLSVALCADPEGNAQTTGPTEPALSRVVLILHREGQAWQVQS